MASHQNAFIRKQENRLMDKVQAKDIRPGFQVDLENDTYADPENNKELLKQLNLEVDEVTHESDECVVISFVNFDSVGFPPKHTLSVVSQ